MTSTSRSNMAAYDIYHICRWILIKWNECDVCFVLCRVDEDGFTTGRSAASSLCLQKFKKKKKKKNTHKQKSRVFLNGDTTQTVRASGEGKQSGPRNAASRDASSMSEGQSAPRARAVTCTVGGCRRACFYFQPVLPAGRWDTLTTNAMTGG